MVSNPLSLEAILVDIIGLIIIVLASLYLLRLCLTLTTMPEPIQRRT